MQNTDLVSDFIVQFFYYLLLLYGFVPISLYVSQNFIRYFQASVFNKACGCVFFRSSINRPRGAKRERV